MQNKFFYISFLLILYTGLIFSQNKWENIGAPNGGNVMSIAEGTNKYLYAGTEYSGIFLSEDNGDTWQSISNGIEEYNNGIRSILAAKNYIFCGTYGALYRSTNDGDKWEKITETFDNSWVFDLESVGKNIFAATSKGLYKLSDNGITWNLADTSLPENDMLAIGKRDSMLIVVYNSSDGIGISTDNGKNWEQNNFWVGTAFDILLVKIIISMQQLLKVYIDLHI